MLFKQQNNDNRRTMILNGNISKTLLFLALPTVLMGIIQALLPLSDALFINNISGTVVASAISYSQPAINAVIAVAQGLSVAAMAMIGQLQGRGDIQKSKKLMMQFFVIALVLGIVAIPITIAIAIPISNNVTSEISNNVFTYISLFSFVLPFLFLVNIFVAFKNALGKPEDAFLRAAFMLVLKIVFNFIFLYIFQLHILGTILASLCSQVLSAIWIIYDLFFKESEYKLSFKLFEYDAFTFKRISRLAIPAILNSLMLNVGFFLINLEVQKYGAVALNGLGIANNITNISFLLPSTVGSVVTTMVSMNIGAGNIPRAKKIVLHGCVLSLIISVFSVGLIIPFSNVLTSLFTKNTDVLYIANDALNIYIYSVFAFGIVMVIQGTYIALGKTKLPLYAGIARIWLFRYIFILIFEPRIGLYSVFYGNLFSNYLAAVILILTLTKLSWKSNI